MNYSGTLIDQRKEARCTAGGLTADVADRLHMALSSATLRVKRAVIA